jgi:hypothetical protein
LVSSKLHLLRVAVLRLCGDAALMLGAHRDFLAIAVVSVLAFAACSDDGGAASTGSGGAGPSTTSVGGGTASQTTVGAGGEASTTGSTSTSGGAGGEATTGVGGAGGAGGSAPLPSCGGIAGLECPPDHYCDHDENDCGAGDGLGTCRPKPQTCNGLVDPVCGCDGTMHSNACIAQIAGVDLNAMGCAQTATTFVCGYKLCDVLSEACVKTGNDAPPPTTSYACVPAPPSCAGDFPSCACASSLATACGGTCTNNVAGSVTIACP